MEAGSSGEESVYVPPVRHGEDFLLGTRVKIVLGFHPYYVAGQLITRDSEQVTMKTDR